MDLTTLLASQINQYMAYDSNFSLDNLKKITYVTASNGVFRVEKTDTAIFKNLIQPIDKPIPGLLPMEPGPELLIPKIPFPFLQMALSFYIDVYDKDGTEASLLFFWNKDNKPLPTHYSGGEEIKGMLSEGQLIVYVPRQINTSGLSEFHMDPMVDYFRDNYSLLVETHSHNSMNAFFSSTDDSNENASQFYGVWGKVKNEIPQFAFRYVSGDMKIEVSPDILFDWPIIKRTVTEETTCMFDDYKSNIECSTEEFLYQGPFPSYDYPSDWMGQHKKKYNSLNKIKTSTDHLIPNPYEYDFFELPHTQDISHMEDAIAIQYMNLADEKCVNDIADNIMDLTADYHRLGYDRLIERSINATKH